MEKGADHYHFIVRSNVKRRDERRVTASVESMTKLTCVILGSFPQCILLLHGRTTESTVD